jgi:hypothetical protein
VRGLFLVKPSGRSMPGRLRRYESESISPDIDSDSRLASDPGKFRCVPILNPDRHLDVMATRSPGEYDVLSHWNAWPPIGQSWYSGNCLKPMPAQLGNVPAPGSNQPSRR